MQPKAVSHQAKIPDIGAVMSLAVMIDYDPKLVMWICSISPHDN